MFYLIIIFFLLNFLLDFGGVEGWLRYLTYFNFIVIAGAILFLSFRRLFADRKKVIGKLVKEPQLFDFSEKAWTVLYFVSYGVVVLYFLSVVLIGLGGIVNEYL